MLKRKVIRDIINNKSQFLTIFLMVFLGVFVFAGIHAYMDGMIESANTFYDDCNLEDLWLVGSFTKKDLEKVKNTTNINNAEGIIEVVTSIYETDIKLDTMFIETNEIAKMKVLEGISFNGESGIWLDAYLADVQDYQVGDVITIVYNGTLITEEIKGIIYTPDHVYNIESSESVFPNHETYGYAYLSVNELQEEIYNFNQIIVDVLDTDNLDKTKMNLEENVSNINAILERDENTSYAGYKSEYEEGETYSVVFTLLFVFIAILSVITTMNRFIKKERNQIGTLKALGFKDFKITLTYLSYSLYISILAIISGIILGSLIIGNFFLEMEMTYYELPNYHIVIKPIVYYVSFCIFLLIILVAYLTCKKILKENVSDSLRLNSPKIKTNNLNMTTKGIFQKLSFSTTWNIRDIIRNKMRSLTAIIGIAGSCMLIVCAFGFKDTLNNWLNLEYETVMNFANKITLTDNYTEEEYINLISLYGDQTSEDIMIELNSKSNVITVNDAEGYLNNIDGNDEIITLKEGINITRKLASELNAEVGDTITFRIYGSDIWYEEEITNIIKDAQSQQIYMTKESLENLGLTYRADTIYTNEEVDTNIPGISSVQNISEIRSGMESMLDVMNSVIILFLIASVILGIVIIYNLGVLSLSEKNYQFATLKVLGFKDQQIKNIFIKQNIWLTIVGIIIGLPLGYLITLYVYKNAIGDNFDFRVVIYLKSYLFAIIGTTLVSLMVNKFLARKISSINMVESLKVTE